MTIKSDMTINSVHIESDAHWHELRSEHIGSSDISCLFGMSMFKSKFTLWHEKAGNFKKDISNNRTKAGHYLERAIAQMVDDKLDILVKETNDYFIKGFLGATPDFLYSDGESGPAVLEVKNMDYMQYKDKCIDDKPPRQYQLQLQHQMHCVGAKKGMIAILVGGNDLKIFKYDYRPKIGELMERKAEYFFNSIIKNNAPDIDDASDLEVVKEIYNWKDFHIDLSKDNEAVSAACDYFNAQIERKKFEKIEKEAKAKILNKMDCYSTAEIGNFKINISRSSDNKGTIITSEMVGDTINARKGVIRLNVKEKNNV